MWPFKKPTQTTCQDAGKLGAQSRISNERAIIRAKCDEMRADMGMPKVEWPQ